MCSTDTSSSAATSSSTASRRSSISSFRAFTGGGESVVTATGPMRSTESICSNFPSYSAEFHLARQVAQFVSLNFSSRGLRQFLDEINPRGKLVGSKLSLAEDADLVDGGRVSRFGIFQHHPGLGFHQTVIVGSADHRCLQHLGMFDQSGFDFEWRDPSAADLKHVVAPPAVNIESIRVPAKGVAGIKPAVHEDLGRPFRIFPIALRQRLSLDQQPPGHFICDVVPGLVNDPDLVASYWLAGRAWAGIAGSVGDVNMSHLGRTDAIHHRHP